MDRTSWIAVIVCIVALFAWQAYEEKHFYHPPQPASHTPSPSSTAPLTISSAAPNNTPININIPENLAPETTTVLSNDDIQASFTSHGGAIQKIELLKHKVDENQLVVLNDTDAEPILNLSGWDGDAGLVNYDLGPTNTAFADGKTVTYRHQLANGIQIDRTYHLSDSYQIDLFQTVTNPTNTDITLPSYIVNLGEARPIYKHDSPASIYTAWMVTAPHAKYSKQGLGAFSRPSFLFIPYGEAQSSIVSPEGPLEWAAVKNQYFTTILTPSTQHPITKSISQRTNLPKFDPNGPIPHGLETHVTFDGLTVPAHGSITDKLNLYAGPKDYQQIKTLGQSQENILDFGFFSWLVKLLLLTMNHVHRGITAMNWHWDLNYGWVIVIVTLSIKLITWPLQSASNRSMKLMQALQPRLKEIQDKYKDDPQKMQTEVMKIYKDFGVNPLGGCLPMLVQLPILLAFYSMLQNSIELRHVSWLWIHDLSQPDTVFSFMGFDLNPLPITMALTQWIMMKLTPTAGDNQQMKVLQFMPLVMVCILYNFASALALYWTVNNLVSIVQTYRNLKKPLPKLERIKRTNPFGRLGDTASK